MSGTGSTSGTLLIQERPTVGTEKWRLLWKDTREKLGIEPVIKDDYYRIMAEAVKTINADSKLKEAMLVYLKPYAFDKYNSVQGYKWAAIMPATFVQWLSQKRKKKITFRDLEPPNITPEDAKYFTQEYSGSIFVQAQIRSSLIGFGKFLVSRYYIEKYPFGDLKVKMPESERTLVYTDSMLDEFYNTVLFGSKPYMTLFFRILLQTGLRPLHAYYLTCGDIGETPTKDAFSRDFYKIEARNVLSREKRKIKEEVDKKVPPKLVFISGSLRNDIMNWCQQNNLSSSGYIFKDFVTLDVFDTFIRRRRESPAISPRMKHKVKYILYGLRHTWTSVMWALTANIGDLIDLGGWGEGNIPLKTYRVSMEPCEALKIVKKWELYVLPDRQKDAQEVERKCGEGATPSTAVQAEPSLKDELSKLWDYVEQQTKKMAEQEKINADLRKTIDELKKKK